MARGALRTLTNKRATYNEIYDAIQSLNRESDRGLAILGASLVDDLLEYFLESRMIAGLSKDDRAHLFGNESPLGSFSARIKAGYAFGLFGPLVRDDLNCMRDIRNVFAHARIPVSFRSKEVVDACSQFRHPTSPKPPRKNAGARVRYLSAVKELCGDFLNKGDPGVADRPTPVLP